MFNCHCRDCQRASGGAFVTVALVRESSLRVVLAKRSIIVSLAKVAAGLIAGFARECGTPLFAKGERAPGYMTIKPGSLDDASWFRPTIDTWAPRAPAWLPLDPALPMADKTPNLRRRDA
jgi:hypothetical protein